MYTENAQHLQYNILLVNRITVLPNNIITLIESRIGDSTNAAVMWLQPSTQPVTSTPVMHAPPMYYDWTKSMFELLQCHSFTMEV